MKTWDTVAIVGVGLIGASIGLALRERNLAREVVGIGRRESTLRTAKRRGAVTRHTTKIAAGVAEAELIVVCTPVENIVEQIRAASLTCKDGALITDAGSTKEEIVFSVDRALSEHNPTRASFVGSHPMAGSEKNGPHHARPDLFEGCATVITPSNESQPKAVRMISQFWRSLGARVLQMPSKEHDQAVATISHLPHLIASVVAAVTPESLLPLVGGGWRDTTRIASGDPHLWRQILMQNRLNVLQAVDRFTDELSEFRRALTYNDHGTIEKLLGEGRSRREAVTPTR